MKKICDDLVLIMNISAFTLSVGANNIPARLIQNTKFGIGRWKWGKKPGFGTNRSLDI
jgi:hypothetical protein